MHTSNPQSKFILSAVRGYVRLLVATLVILSTSLIGYLYWHDSLRHRLLEIANDYHLETALNCVILKEEMMRSLPSQANSQVYIQQSDEQSRSQKDYTNFVYLLEKHYQAISQLHEVYGSMSDQAMRFEPIIHKAKKQLARIKVLLVEAGATSSYPHVNSEATLLLGSFTHSIEQLRRLHIIARDEISNELDELTVTRGSYLFTIFIATLLLGSLIVYRIMGAIGRLVEAQKQAESTLRQSATFFENTSEGMIITDVDAKILAVNKAFEKITGFSQEEALGKTPSILKSDRHDRDFYKTMWSLLLQNGEWKGEIWGRRKNGEVFPKWQTISAVRDDDGRLTHYVSVFTDISRIKESQAQLYHLAHHDALTGLPNRMLLDARLEHSLQHAHREDTNVAVLFLDLDHFKKINDSLGHPAGDRLLQLVAERLLVSVRAEDTVARLGGDELSIVLGSLDSAWHSATVAQAILGNFSEPFELEGQDVFVSVSIGISTYPQDGKDARALLRNADAAMYEAKSAGRNRYHFYSKELTANAGESLALETNLHRALEREEFLLHFQPQLSLLSGNVVGVEALVRWQHPEIGMLSPANFIPIAEESGLIGAIGKWVLHTACAQAKAWQNAGLTPLRIAVNLSGIQFGQTNIIQEIRDVLEDTGLDPSYLELELTESSVMKQAESSVKKLDALRELGITLAVDDFGTGYSSLGYLKRFPVDRLKIDRSFVRDIPQDENDIALAKAIIALGHNLNLSVVAEGVESQAQRELLASIGCDEMQGFLYSAPRSASELMSLLSTPARSACMND